MNDENGGIRVVGDKGDKIRVVMIEYIRIY